MNKAVNEHSYTSLFVDIVFNSLSKSLGVGHIINICFTSENCQNIVLSGYVILHPSHNV